jgi:3-dehydroquinate synthase
LTIETVRVELGERSYPVLIGPGLIARAGEHIASALPGRRVAVVTDPNVAKLHLTPLLDSLARSAVPASQIVVPAGETSKSFDQLQAVVNGVLEARLERNDAVVALGGGVIGDLAGFAAAIVRRGMQFVQIRRRCWRRWIPASAGKDRDQLPVRQRTWWAPSTSPRWCWRIRNPQQLPAAEFAAGYAEVVKYGLIGDAASSLAGTPGGGFLRRPGADQGYRRERQGRRRAPWRRTSMRRGERALLNLGHTFGHALEAACRYDPRG